MPLFVWNYLIYTIQNAFILLALNSVTPTVLHQYDIVLIIQNKESAKPCLGGLLIIWLAVLVSECVKVRSFVFFEAVESRPSFALFVLYLSFVVCIHTVQYIDLLTTRHINSKFNTLTPRHTCTGGKLHIFVDSKHRKKGIRSKWAIPFYVVSITSIASTADHSARVC
jgi:hypothetical protein